MPSLVLPRMTPPRSEASVLRFIGESGSKSVGAVLTSVCKPSVCKLRFIGELSSLVSVSKLPSECKLRFIGELSSLVSVSKLPSEYKLRFIGEFPTDVSVLLSFASVMGFSVKSGKSLSVCGTTFVSRVDDVGSSICPAKSGLVALVGYLWEGSSFPFLGGVPPAAILLLLSCEVWSWSVPLGFNPGNPSFLRSSPVCP